MTHTKEPWVYSQSGSQCWVIGADGKRVCIPEAVMSRDDYENQANARRIVACVNACEGIPQDWLESGLSGCLQNVRVERDMYKHQRDNMLSALKIISESEICPAVLAQVAINAIKEVEK